MKFDSFTRFFSEILWRTLRHDDMSVKEVQNYTIND
jgi:hypothetical protein